ncbi:MAG: hypothetical protein WB392_04530 [Methanotrichaceae archaeon]
MKVLAFILMLVVLFITASGQEAAECWYAIGHKLIDRGNIDKGIQALDRVIELKYRCD